MDARVNLQLLLTQFCVYIDPIDGTTNFAAGYPSFGVSVAGMALSHKIPYQAFLPPYSYATAVGASPLWQLQSPAQTPC